jgi:hypothetical protein
MKNGKVLKLIHSARGRRPEGGYAGLFLIDCTAGKWTKHSVVVKTTVHLSERVLLDKMHFNFKMSNFVVRVMDCHPLFSVEIIKIYCS